MKLINVLYLNQNENENIKIYIMIGIIRVIICKL